MNYYILTYKTVDNYIERRQAFRAEHLDLATDYFHRKELIMAGALDNPADEALLVFQGENEHVAHSFALKDPYVKNGLITEWSVRKWNVVIGNE